MRRQRSHNLGFTLIDLMIGIALSMVLTMAVLQLFSITRQAYLTSTQFGEMLENANAAMSAIQKVASRAGHIEPFTPIFAGCYATGTPAPFLNNAGNLPLRVCRDFALSKNMVSFALQNGNGSDAGVCWAGNNVNPYQYGNLPDSSCGYGGGSAMTDGYFGGSQHSSNQYYTGGSGTNAIYLLRSGIDAPGLQGGRIFSFIGVDGAPGESDSLMIIMQGEGYDNSATTIRDCQGNPILRNTLSFNSFYIMTDETGPALVCSTSALTSTGSEEKPAIKVASNVQAMRVRYAVDTDGDGSPNVYVDGATATTPAFSSKVVGIQIELLMRSTNAVSQVLDTKTYSLLTKTYGPFNDRFLRRQFSMTFKTQECIPSFRKACGGVLFSGTDWAGNTAVDRINAGDTVWFRQGPTQSCGGGTMDNDRAGCSMDATGMTTALFHEHCVTADRVGTKVQYMTKSSVSGSSVSCKAVD